MEVVFIIVLVIVVSGGLFFVPAGLAWIGERIADSSLGGATPILNDNDSFESWR